MPTWTHLRLHEPIYRRPARLLIGLVALLALLIGGQSLAAAGPPTDGPIPLDAYPRPRDDNRRGIHWAPVLLAQSPDVVDRYLAEVQAMDMRWLAILQPDQPTLAHPYLVSRAVAQGIEPVLRLYRPFNDPFQHLDALAPAAVATGVHYLEVYSNPNVAGAAGGWRPGQAVDPEGLALRWAAAARTIQAAGGYPGLPSLSPTGSVDDETFLRRFLRALKAQNALDTLDRAWLPVQAYMGNRPLDDPQGFRRYERYHQILLEEIGRELPLIATEGGALLGDRSIADRPPVTEDLMAQQTVTAFRFMQGQAPDYFFAFMPWLLVNQAAGGYGSAWERQAWFPLDRPPLAVVDAVKALAGTQPEARPTPDPARPSTQVPLQYAAEPTPAPSFQAAEESGRPLPSGPASSPLAGDPTPSPTQSAGNAAPEVRVLSRPARTLSTGPVTVSEGTVVLPTYDYRAAFVETRSDDPIYPAPRLDHSRVGPPEPRSYRAIFLENDYLRLTILPELGGRIYRWEDKQTGRDILYANPVVKPTRWGIRGWWLAVGGMEWVFPLPDHGLVEYRPWTVDVVAEPRSAGVTLRYQGPKDVTATVMVSLNADQRFFAVTTELRNNGADPARVHYWVNAMPAPAPGNTVDPESRLVWPAPAIQVHGVDGAPNLAPNQVTAWPWGDGGDLSRLANWPTHLSFFAPDGARQGAMGLADPTDELAVIRAFPHRQVPGVKVFYGPGLDPSLWTDGEGGHYLELWGGPGTDFASPITLAPGQSLRWSEQWYTVPGLGPFVAANGQAALALRPQGQTTEVRLAPTGPAATDNPRLRIQVDGTWIFDGPVSLSTQEVTRLAVDAPLAGHHWIVQLLDAHNRVLLAYDSRPPADGDEPPVEWDPRLDDLKIRIVRAQVAKGQPYWRLVKAEFQDPQEGGGRHHIFIEVLDENGQRIVGQEVQVLWPDGSATVVTEDKPAPEYAANFPMYGDLGGYSVRLPGPSDMVTGMGLPGGRMHVVYRLVFQRSVKE